MLQDGSLVRTASTAQDLALIVTLFRRKDGSFEKKEAAFTLVEEGRDGSERKLGTERFDLAAFAGATSVPKPLDLSLAEGRATLRGMITARWLRRMSVGHDQSSDGSVSVASTASARHGAAEPAASSPPTSLSSLPHVTLAEGGAAAASGGSSEGGSAALWIPPPPDLAAAAGGGAVAEARDELRGAHAELEAGRLEAKRLKSELEVLRKKQRELKRGQTRDDVVLQLEVQLELKSVEMMAAEEDLSNAFSGVVRDLHERINSLTAERDRLLAQAEVGKRGFR